MTIFLASREKDEMRKLRTEKKGVGEKWKLSGRDLGSAIFRSLWSSSVSH